VTGVRSATHFLRRALRRVGVQPPVARGRQQASDFYDRTFEADDYWKRHYTGVHDYCCWTVIVDRMRRQRARRLLEIGCGTGQLAGALRDAALLEAYCGFDFSPQRLAHARTVCPGWRFEVADAFKTELFDSFDYDAALSTEFLEHVEGDLEVLARLRPGTWFIGTVPNFPFVSHVRHFADTAEVSRRYAGLFERLEVVPIPLNDKGKTLFVLEGVRNARTPPGT
jgi:SAM-dependent methyltransferase